MTPFLDDAQTAYSRAIDLARVGEAILHDLPPSTVLADVLNNIAEALSSLCRLAGKDDRPSLDKALARIASEPEGGSMTPYDVAQLRLAYSDIGSVVATLADLLPDTEAASTITNLGLAMHSLAGAIAENEPFCRRSEEDGDALGRSFVLLAKALMVLHAPLVEGCAALHDEIVEFLRGFGYPDIQDVPISGEEVDRG